VSGPKAVLELVKDSTGVVVNHLVDLDGHGLAGVVNGLGCLYVDVDRPYQLETATANAPNGQLLAGYQRLCGATALQYALFTGDGGEPMREARQQELLRALAVPGGIWHDHDKLVRLFTRYARSDITDVHTLRQVFGLLIELERAPVQSVPFGQGVGQFLDPPQKSASTQRRPARRLRLRRVRPQSSLDQASGLPSLYPTLVPKGWGLTGPRVYDLDGTGDGSPPSGERASYRWAFNGPGQGEYAGFQATAWRNPPMLNNPTSEMTDSGRTYKLFYDEGRLRTVAWQTPHGSFWVSNSLTETLSSRQMIALANGITEAGGKPG
jgi:hypothetical protein